MLDIDHGTYPYVTSSSATAGGVCTGLGVGPRAVNAVLGIVKAYTTRVGEGPLPTELTGQEGEDLRTRGQEFGAVTGRPRRCGWFDAVVVRHAVRVNGIDGLALTKLDVLDGLERIPVCNAYRCGDRPGDRVPGRPVRRLESCEPVLEWLPGWSQPTRGVTRVDDLPEAAPWPTSRRLEALTGVPVAARVDGRRARRDHRPQRTAGDAWFGPGLLEDTAVASQTRAGASPNECARQNCSRGVGSGLLNSSPARY